MTGTPSFLLDTNILSDLVRNPQGRVMEKIADVGSEQICTNVIVSAELRYGAVKSGSTKLQERVDLILSAVNVLSVETPVDLHYARLRDYLTREGMPIGPNDLLIAAHGLAADMTVVTANTREFSRVPGLKVENWLA